jgi:hypothetical protein
VLAILPPMKTLLSLTAALALLAGCATRTTPAPVDDTAASPDTSKPGAAETAVGQAVTSPLSDFNLVQAPVPPVLREAQKAPYAMPADAGCDSLAGHVRALDDVLGADLDVPATPGNPSLVERSGKEVGNAAAGALKSAAEGIVPFRGWVRKLSGAERYSKDVAAAIVAGTVRRAYLKGVGEARGCVAPAAPAHTEHKA